MAGFVSCLVNRTSFGITILYSFIKLMLVAPANFFSVRELYRGQLDCLCVFCFDVFYDMDYGVQNNKLWP